MGPLPPAKEQNFHDFTFTYFKLELRCPEISSACNKIKLQVI